MIIHKLLNIAICLANYRTPEIKQNIFGSRFKVVFVVKMPLLDT